MARLFIDGFESGSANAFDSVIGDAGLTVASTAQKAGTHSAYSMKATYPNWNVGNYRVKNISSVDTIYFKFQFRAAAINYSTGILAAANADGIQVMLCFTNNRYLEVRKGSHTGTLLGTSSAALSLNTWYLIEGKFYVHDSAGTIDIKINGVPDAGLAGTGLDTKDQTSSGITKIFLGAVSGYAGYVSGDFYFDDFVIDDATYPGNSKIQGIVPTGAGNDTNWTPSAGDNYACVDEVPNSATDYISTNTTGHVDTFACGDLAGLIGSVKAVQVQAVALTEGSPTPTGLQMVARSGTTNYFGSTNVVPSSAKEFMYLWEVDPDDAGVWTEADVNALQIGVKAVA